MLILAKIMWKLAENWWESECTGAFGKYGYMSTNIIKKSRKNVY